MPSLKEHTEFSSFYKYVWVSCGVIVTSLLEDCCGEGVVKAVKSCHRDIVLPEFHTVQELASLHRAAS